MRTRKRRIQVFVSLISRLYDVSAGEVLVGGHNVKEYEMEALRNQVSVVLPKQCTALWRRLTTICAGEICRQLIKNARKPAQSLRIVQMSSVHTFPQGYDTRIEQGGNNVSGGQKQRLCVARALLQKPKDRDPATTVRALWIPQRMQNRRAFREEIPDGDTN